MKYEKALRIISTSNRTEYERAENLIKEMCRLTTDLLDYRYAVENYKIDGSSTVLQDNLAKIKNSLALVVSDIDIYMDQMGITNKVKQKAVDRVNRIANKVRKNGQ